MFVSLACPVKYEIRKLQNNLVDKGFKICNECAAKRIYVVVLPGKRGSSQTLPSEVTKTK